MERSAAAVTALTVLALGAGAGAQETDVARQIQELKAGQQQIRRELAEIKRLLERQAQGAQAARSPVAGRLFSLGDNPVKGESTAKLTLVEFTDYQ